jgi:flagellar basal-body rod modification protein FlgD
MTTVQSTTSSTSAASAATVASQTSAIQDRFLKLLVTQMKNQDPLNPMDNAQVTSQMAQLSTVSGIDKLNATVQALSDSMAAAQSLQAASMIGHAALVPGTEIDLLKGKSNAAVN